MKFFIYRQLTRFFQWLESAAAEASYHTNICEDCGQSKYYGRPCIGLPISYKEVR